ncbi:hypothetical protein B0H17DRAFT_1210218 [Mycena rosella]|uniref:Uncharacterized protein n=1 Tax=Mycena rosella TaxID=1033263 RepID=A0AAD7CWR0_MYCRO|nr:hypothetical protein B0H17DRAFT_1210218 [Mycena rosella]
MISAAAPDNDASTYINRAAPGTHLTAAISDLNGRWATGTHTDMSCTGLVGDGGNSTQIAQQEQAAAAANSSKNTGGISGVLVVAVGVLPLGTVLYTRQRRCTKSRPDNAKAVSSAFRRHKRRTDPLIPLYQRLRLAFIPHQPRSPQSPGASTVSNAMSTSNASRSAGPYDRRRFSACSLPGAETEMGWNSGTPWQSTKRQTIGVAPLEGSPRLGGGLPFSSLNFPEYEFSASVPNSLKQNSVLRTVCFIFPRRTWVPSHPFGLM